MRQTGHQLHDLADLPRVVDVRYLHDHVLWLRFDDGLEGEVDLADSLEGPLYDPIRDPAAFAQVGLDCGTLAWPGDMDWSPESLHDRVAAAKGLDPRARDDAWNAKLANIAGMPEISRFYGIVIHMLADEHNPPHFHAKYAEFAISVTIRDEIVSGRFPGRALRLVSQWRQLHEAELLENWNRQRAGEPPRPIAPLP